MMRVLIINTDYPGFLGNHYAASPELANAPYDQQMDARNSTLFGAADFYSHGLRAQGAEAWEIHANNQFMQEAWAREHGLPPAEPTVFPRAAERLRRSMFGKRLEGRLLRILAAQLRYYRPDVVLNQDMYLIPASFLKKHRPPGTLVVGQIASPLPGQGTFTDYDLIVSSLPNLVAFFRARGLRAELNRLAFDPRVLDRVQLDDNRQGVIFVGSLTGGHGRRYELLDFLSRHLDGFEIWGAGVETLPVGSPIRACHKGEAWGIDMYRLFARAAIAVNIHIDMAQGHANNLRLYEAAGMGTLLLTDACQDLSCIFNPGSEVVAYSSPGDCLASIHALTQDTPRRLEIAKAGHRKVLEAHNFTHRMGELLDTFQHCSGKAV